MIAPMPSQLVKLSASTPSSGTMPNAVKNSSAGSTSHPSRARRRAGRAPDLRRGRAGRRAHGRAHEPTWRSCSSANCSRGDRQAEELLDVAQQGLGRRPGTAPGPRTARRRAPSWSGRRRTAGTPRRRMPANLASMPLTIGTSPASVIQASASASVSRPFAKKFFAMVLLLLGGLGGDRRGTDAGLPTVFVGSPLPPSTAGKFMQPRWPPETKSPPSSSCRRRSRSRAASSRPCRCRAAPGRRWSRR